MISFCTFILSGPKISMAEQMRLHRNYETNGLTMTVVVAFIDETIQLSGKCYTLNKVIGGSAINNYKCRFSTSKLKISSRK